MSLNWKEIDLILSELNLEGCFIQQIHQPVHQYLIFDLHKPGAGFTLFCSLAPGACRLHKLTHKIENPQRPQRFASFLRARIKGARILSACQLQGERIVKITVQRAEEKTLLWLRLWSNAANLIVTDESGNVLDACYRRTKRNEISGGFYNPEAAAGAFKQDNPGKERFSVRTLSGEGSFNAKIEAWYFEHEETIRSNEFLNQALHIIDSRIKYYLENLRNLETQLKLTAGYTRYKEIGDLIMAALSRIDAGSQWLVTEDFYHDNQSIEIELDPVKKPQANAEAYYLKYRKARTDFTRHEEKISRIKELLEDLENKRNLITTGKDPELIKSLAKEKEKKQPLPGENRFPGLVFYSAQYKILVGRSAAENDELLRSYVKGNDYWFHTRDYAGSYIFVKAFPGKSLPLDVMLDAGNLALFYSRGKNSGKGNIYYTQVKYLRRPKQGKKGLVLPTQEKNLSITLDETRIEKMKKNL